MVKIERYDYCELFKRSNNIKYFVFDKLMNKELSLPEVINRLNSYHNDVKLKSEIINRYSLELESLKKKPKEIGFFIPF